MDPLPQPHDPVSPMVLVSPRLNPYLSAPKAMQELVSFQEFTDQAGVSPGILELVRILVSQLHRCPSAIARHMHRARLLGESEERVGHVLVWREHGFYTVAETAAFAWTETVVLSREDSDDAVFVRARDSFTEEGLVELTVAIAASIARNRIAVCFREATPNGPQGSARPPQVHHGASN